MKICSRCGKEFDDDFSFCPYCGKLYTVPKAKKETIEKSTKPTMEKRQISPDGNKEIKLLAAGAGVKMWQIADELGIRDCNLSRKLRYKLTESEKEEIVHIIETLRNEKGE